ncbi:MAG TPA: SRPBCC domain-containing protein [Candidatus Sulfotelmatobacter sp.]|nr:SRPBCC domain-containing protein [Candidatus Sulfotelmatobacter sp.]
MTTTIITPDQDAIIAEIQIAAPPERVFKAISDEGELMRWFTSPECPVQRWKMEPRAGGHYSYVTQKGSLVVNGISEFECHGEIVEFDPPRLLAYTWYANWHDDPKRSTMVRWELAPRQGGTHVKVTHTGLASLPIASKDYSQGWPGVVEQLKKFVEK